MNNGCVVKEGGVAGRSDTLSPLATTVFEAAEIRTREKANKARGDRRFRALNK